MGDIEVIINNVTAAVSSHNTELFVLQVVEGFEPVILRFDALGMSTIKEQQPGMVGVVDTNYTSTQTKKIREIIDGKLR